jgi:vacuolar-type H+-ATPase subunit D/Vma8
MKTRLVGAKKGFSLLKKKSDALMAKFRKIIKELRLVRRFQILKKSVKRPNG